MNCERMTILEVCEDLRRRGSGMTQRTVSNGIVSGALPFGKLIATGGTGRRTFLILRRDYEAWIAGGMQTTDPEPAPGADPGPGPEWELFTSHVATQEDADIIWEISVKAWRRR